MTRSWYVTLIDRGVELAIEVEAPTKDGARREAHYWHPNGHIVHIELGHSAQRSPLEEMES